MAEEQRCPIHIYSKTRLIDCDKYTQQNKIRYKNEYTNVHESCHLDKNTAHLLHVPSKANRSFRVVPLLLRWVSVILEMMGNAITFAAAIVGVAGRGYISSGVVGLSVTYAISVSRGLRVGRNCVIWDTVIDVGGGGEGRSIMRKGSARQCWWKGRERDTQRRETKTLKQRKKQTDRDIDLLIDRQIDR